MHSEKKKENCYRSLYVVIISTLFFLTFILDIQLGSMATNIDSVINLNDEIAMPLFGLGTAWTNECSQAVSYAIEHGYKMIDTAQRYG